MEKRAKRLVLFTDAYPYGMAESFLHNEIAFTSAAFKEIIIYPLYIPDGAREIRREVPENVVVKEPLLPFDHKEREKLFNAGIFNTAPLFFSVSEFFGRRVYKSSKKSWLFASYLLTLRSILGNRKKMKEIIADLTDAPSTAYFYWGDKSALIVPFLKKRLQKRVADCKYGIPKFVVRFHGSDLYEEAKGFLPFREMLYRDVDYAVTVTKNGEEYIRSRYRNQPKNIATYYLGSFDHNRDCPNLFPYNDTLHPDVKPGSESEPNGPGAFNILSCSNVIGIKRVELIATAMLYLEQDKELHKILEENNISHICWTHIGGGALLEPIKQLIIEHSGQGETCNNIAYQFKGRMPHNEVIDYYQSHYIDLYLLTSSSEGLPIAIMEALSFGTPVIATDVGGIKEMIVPDPKTPFCRLLPKDITGEDIADAVRQWIKENSRKNCAIAARKEWEERWSCTANYTKFADFLKGL